MSTPLVVSVGEPDCNGDFPVIHVPSGGSIATKYSRSDAEALAAELNALVVPFDAVASCDACTLGWELLDDDLEGGETYQTCQHCAGALALDHLRNEAVRLRIMGAVI